MIILCKTTTAALNVRGSIMEDDPQVERFYRLYDDICDYSFVEYIAPWGGIDEASLKKQGLDNDPERNMNGETRRMRKFCEFLFYMMTIDSAGNIRPCCLHEAPVFGVFHKDETLVDIWNSRRLLNIRLSHLEEKLDACNNCGVNSFIDTQSIDEDAKYIYEKLRRFA